MENSGRFDRLTRVVVVIDAFEARIVLRVANDAVLRVVERQVRVEAAQA